MSNVDDRGRTLQDAIKIAFEGIPGAATGWVMEAETVKAVRSHVVAWIEDYARNRGVILDTKLDIEPELDDAIAKLHIRGIALARTRTPVHDPK